ncbi:hypothetical protein DICPUDRAFT_52776 [Dictyostelium purpureum]|uniref:Exportin-7/Ran-binding protein 17 TPR repeats domain-containing protein n=1 Tax=Dictyostelium purpureum TaxID=5786 RepID=F0Z9Y4_DICPU|nr:uncharacterized protein DICPUDRAFT_52776 [Dictyostelium purpureum]EGC39230.1 hypothetical protein DICPUDRAFT_52776 [Dictyostelium purpureum]|eukprot:XP_003284257.1 hypothetical protein DICPUDRAFT_52776 [Dictyostelium purpureum]
MEQFALSLVFKLYSRLIKYSWQDEPNKKSIVVQIKNLISKSLEFHCIGLRILKDIISEFNEYVGDHLTVLQHRNISISLRDNVLLDFFCISLDSLNFSLQNIMDDKLKNIRELALDLSYSCLSFDFIKTTSIDSSEEILTVQIPSQWKATFDENNPLELFFKVYKSLHSTKSLECILQVVSIRRSFFTTEEERVKFLTNLIQYTLDVLKNRIGFTDSNNHLAFSRVMERLKTNYHLNNLVSVNGYHDWIANLSNFTIDTLKVPQFSPNSIYFLLSLWAKLVSSIIYIKGDPSKTSLDKYSPVIMEAFINSKINNSFSDEEDEQLMDYEKMVEILEGIPHLGRITYQATCQQIIYLFDSISQKFLVEANPTQLEIYERQCAWLVYIIGCLILGRTSINSSEEHDKIDGELSVRVMVLININDKKLVDEASKTNNSYLHRTSRIALELSFIYFMQNFRKIYIGENSISSSKIYQKITELNGPTDHTSVLFSIIQKIGFNFNHWAENDEIIKKSLEMFWDSVNGHSTSKLLIENKVTKDILKGHGPAMFPFLEKNQNSRNRTTLYKTIGKLLFTDENLNHFDEFIEPFDQTIKRLLDIKTPEEFRTEDIKKKTIGLLRDLRGLVTSAVSKRTYLLFFEWIHTHFSDVLIKIINVWVDTPEVTTALLKFLSEFVFNRQSRLIFDSSSPNGFVIFRDTSKILVTYASLILKANVSKQDLYKYKIKGIQTSMLLFTRCLVGGYCNFGVFELYGDPSFTSAIDYIFQLCLSVSLDELLSFPKASKSYITMLEALCLGHSLTIIQLNPQYFLHIMKSLHRCLDSSDVTISSSSCTSIEKIVTVCYYQMKKKNSTCLNSIRQNFFGNHNTLYEIIDKIISIIIYEDNYNQFIFSKLLLTCIIFSQDTFNQLKQKYIHSFNPQHSDKVEKAFIQLMENTHDNLDTKNKDKFTTNVTIFKKEMKSIITISRYL